MTRYPPLFAVLLLAMIALPAKAQDPDSLVFAFQQQADPVRMRENTARVTEFLSRELGMPVRTVVPTDYAGTVQAMASRKADVAYVSAIPFLLARRDAGATILLAEQREDAQGNLRTNYDSVLVVRKDSPLQSIEDLIANARQTRMVFTSSTSTSGYIMAYYRFVQEGLLQAKQDAREVFRSVAFAGGYTQALEQVVAGRGDVCAVSFYTVEGPRADVYLPKEKRDQLRVLARTSAVPTHLVCARGELSESLRNRITEALIKLADAHPELLADVYGARSLVRVDEDEHVRAAVEALRYMDLPVDNLVR